MENARLAGVLCIAQATERDWTPAEVAIAEDVAHRVWDAITRVRAAADLGESESRLAAELTTLTRLHELTERLMARPNLSSALDEILDAALTLHETSMGAIQIFDPASKSLRLAAHRGFTPATVSEPGFNETLLGSAAAETIRAGQQVIVEDFETARDYVAARSAAAALGQRSAQAAPLMTRQGELQGVLTTYASEPHRPPQRILRVTGLYARLAAHLIERMRAEQALLESEQRFRVAIEAAHMGFWDWDVAKGVITWERTHNRLMGIPLDQTTGTLEQFIACIHPDDRSNVSSALEHALTQGSDYAADFRALHPDGAIRWIAGYGRPTAKVDGKVLRLIGGVLDITDRKQIEMDRAQLLRREQAARTEAEAANHLKDEFLAALSHELRTPLSAIILWAKLLGENRNHNDEQLREGLGAIKSSAEDQRGLIEDLLDVSRITSGKLRLAVRNVELVPILKDALDNIAPAAMAKTIAVTAELDENVGVVELDAERFRQIAWNLLNNAVKFTGVGGSIQVRLWRNQDEIEMIVKDDGRGISPEFLPHVFERFRQFEPASTRTEGGLGLGLAIAKQLVELHGGTINAHSDGIGRGATFVVRLPLPKLKQAGRKKKPAGPRDPVDLTDKRIMIVEDDAATRNALIKLMRQAGAVVIAAERAATATLALKQSRPDLLISDIGLPGEDGYSLLRGLREWEQSSGLTPVPAVALTAFAGDGHRQRALDAGFQQHLGKPIDPDQLLAVVKSLLPDPSQAAG